MSAVWCCRCGGYVQKAESGLSCGHDDPGRHPSDGTHTASPSGPDSIAPEQAKELIASGDAIGLGEYNRGQKAFREEVSAVVERVVREFPLSYYDIVAVLTQISHDMMHEAMDRKDEEDG